jgi:hypothetical protein
VGNIYWAIVATPADGRSVDFTREFQRMQIGSPRLTKLVFIDRAKKIGRREWENR